MKIKSPKNFWAGLMFISFGLFFLIGARKYQLGSAARMGPAYFPTLVAGAITIIGGIVVFQSFVVEGAKVAMIPLRVIFYTTLSLILFGYLLKPLGLVLALVLLVVISGYAGHEFKLKEMFYLSAVMIVLSILVFVKGLNLPFPLWPQFLMN
jgi:hypothetical protein